MKEGQQIVPKASPLAPIGPAKGDVPEERIFDKAEEAETMERLGFEREQLAKEKIELEKSLSDLEEDKKAEVEKRIQFLETELERLDAHRDAMKGKQD